MEEVFFFQYHLRVDKFTCMKYYVNERRYIIERFIQQKNSEKEEIDKENASDPSVKKVLKIVERFIETHRVMCYGGTAINSPTTAPKVPVIKGEIPRFSFFFTLRPSGVELLTSESWLVLVTFS